MSEDKFDGHAFSFLNNDSSISMFAHSLSQKESIWRVYSLFKGISEDTKLGKTCVDMFQPSLVNLIFKIIQTV